MSDSTEFPKGERVHLVTLPIPGKYMPALQVGYECHCHDTGLEFASIGEWLAWMLFSEEQGSFDVPPISAETLRAAAEFRPDLAD